MAHEDPIPPVEVEPEPEDRYASLDPETRARRDAALRLVRKYGDPGRSRAARWRSSASTTGSSRRSGGWGS